MKNPVNSPIFSFRLVIAVILAAVLAACSSSTSSVEETSNTKKAASETAATETETAATDTEQAKEENEDAASSLDAANIVKKPGSVQNRGGYIRILVNKQPITNYDLQRRAKFMQLRRVSGNRTKLAEQEMIEQVIKLQEAKRRNMLVSDKQVEDAFGQFAARNRSDKSRMTSQLNQFGVGASHFKDFIRTQMSWQRLVQARFQAETNQVSERDVATMLRKSGSDKPEVTEYNLQQVIFVVPQNRRSKQTLAARRVEANAFRQRFSSCAQSVELAKALKDVSVLDRRRIMEPELPENWVEEVSALSVNETSRPQETGRGIELMAVCNKRVVTDDRAAQITTQNSEFDSFNEKGNELAKSYLKELVSNATIVYR